MKNNILNILKYTTINNLKLNKYKDKSGRKSAFKIAFIYLAIGIFIVGYVLIYSSSMYQFAKQKDMQTYIVPLFILITMLFVLFRIIRMASDVLFKSKDYDLLMSMPVSHKEIFSSKLIYIVLMNYITTFLIILPATIYMMIVEKLSIAYLFVSILITLFVPVIPMVIGTIISVIIGYLSSKTKFTSFITNIALIAVTILLVVFPNMLTSYVSRINVTDIDSMVKKVFYPIYMIKNGLSTYSIIDILGFVLINVGLIYVYVILTNKLFIRINQKLKEQYQGKKYVAKKIKQQTPIFTMYKKEIKRLFGTSIYFLNTCIGLILLIFAALGSIFSDNTSIINALEMPELSTMLEPIVIAIVVVAISMSCTTGCSISLEGKNMWIYKTMPVKEMDVFLSKILVNLTVTIPTILLSGIIFIARFGLNRQYAIIIFVLPILLSISTSIFGILINLKFPIFNYEADVYVVKKSLSSMVSMLLPMVLVLSILVGVLGMKGNYVNSYLMCIFITVIIDLIEVYILERWGIKKFRKIEL